MMGVVTLAAVLASGLDPGTTDPTPDRGRPGLTVSSLQQQAPQPRIWLDRGADPVLQAGDRVRVYYRTDSDAYTAIFQIDTDGATRMLYPRSPTENHYARANRDYRVLFPRSAYWNVNDRPGVGYLFVVTSPIPFDLSDFRYSHNDRGWDLSVVGSTVYSDPYQAMDDYVARLVPEWETVDYGLDFISYSVGGAYEYPRFLCYQCHGFRPYTNWNPYRYSCVNFRVVVYDDPYYYPARRYPANRVVLVGPRNPTPPRFVFKERAADEPGTPVTVVRQEARVRAPVVGRPGTDPDVNRGRVSVPSGVPAPNRTRRRDPPSGGPSSGDVQRAGPDGGRVTPPAVGPSEPRRPTLQRRATPPNGSSTVRPVPRRPAQSAPPSRGSTRPPARRPPTNGTR